MSTHGANNHPAPVAPRRPRPGQAAAAGDVAGHIDGASPYLTDGVFLYRVVRSVPSEVGELLELEDCFCLDVVRVAPADLRARRLRAVTPAAGER